MSFGIQLESCPTVDVSAHFRRVRKIAKSDRYLRHVCLSYVCPSVRPSVRPSAWNNSALTGRIFMKFDVWVFFENLWRKFKFHYNLTVVTGTLREDLCTFMIVCR